MRLPDWLRVRSSRSTHGELILDVTIDNARYEHEVRRAACALKGERTVDGNLAVREPNREPLPAPAYSDGDACPLCPLREYRGRVTGGLLKRCDEHAEGPVLHCTASSFHNYPIRSTTVSDRLAIPLPAYTVTDTDLRTAQGLHESDPAAHAAIMKWATEQGIDLEQVPMGNHFERDTTARTITYTRALYDEGIAQRWRQVHKMDREPDPFPALLVRWPDFPDRDDLVIAAQGAKVSAEEVVRLRQEVAEIIRGLQQPLVVPEIVREDVGDDAIAFAQGALTAVSRSLDRALNPPVDEVASDA